MELAVPDSELLTPFKWVHVAYVKIQVQAFITSILEGSEWGSFKTRPPHLPRKPPFLKLPNFS